MRRALILVVSIAVLALVFCAWLASTLVGTAPLRAYHFYEHSPRHKIGTFPGESIRSTGLCVEVWRKGRIDTIICGRILVTETTASMLQ